MIPFVMYKDIRVVVKTTLCELCLEFMPVYCIILYNVARMLQAQGVE